MYTLYKEDAYQSNDYLTKTFFKDSFICRLNNYFCNDNMVFHVKHFRYNTKTVKH